MADRPGRPRPAPRPSWAATGFAVALLALALLVVLPLAELVVAALDDGSRGVRAALSGTSGRAVVNTLWTSAAITVLAVVAGTAAALVTERSHTPGRSWLRAAMVAALVSAPLVNALGWARAYGRGGLLDDWLGVHWPGLFGPAGIVVVGAGGAVPLAYLVVAAGLASRAEPDLERAARASGAGPLAALRTVTLPLARPSIGAGAALVFVSAVNSFEVPAVLGIPAGFPTMTTKLYQNLTLSADPAAFTAAAVLATGLVVVAAAVIGPADALTGLARAPRTGGSSGAPLAAGRRSWAPAAALWAFLLVTVVVPLVALVLVALTRGVGLAPVPANWTWDNFTEALASPFLDALVTSLQLAAGAATVVVLLGAVTAALTRTAYGRALGSAVTLTFALAGSSLAVAVLLAYGPSLRDTLAIILIAYVAKFWALGHRPLAGAVERVPADQVRAGRAAGASPAVVVATVVAPMVQPALAAAWLLVFLFAVHELTISSLLYGPGTETLAVVVLNQQEIGNVGVTSALSVLLTLIIAVAAGLLLGARRAARRLAAVPPGPAR